MNSTRQSGTAFSRMVFALMQFFFSPVARRFVGSFRTTPGHLALESRSRPRLHRDGACANDRLAFSRPCHLRNHDFKYPDRDGLHRRRYAERKTRRSVRDDRRGVRRRLYSGSRHWWIARRRRSASAFLGCSRIESGELALGLPFSCRNLCAKNQRKEFTLRRANPVGALVLLRSHPNLFRLTTIQFLAYVSHRSVSRLGALRDLSFLRGAKQ